MATKTTYKVEILNDHKRHVLYNNSLSALIRADVMSYHVSAKKFKAYVGINTDSTKFTFGCTCTTGNRLFGCVHTTVLVYLFAFHF